jgi:hypothetical protein
MPLQNRVDPFGRIHAVAARGLFTGNRGVIHDPDTRNLLARRWSTKAWIVCDCVYRGLKREVMGRNAPSGGAGWTNLFFLDEPTALAAGHRPCFTCRRAAANAYADCFGKAFAIACPKAGEIDARLHRERLASGGPPRPIHHRDVPALPEGAMIAAHGTAVYALRGKRVLRWSFDGYAEAVLPDAALTMVTPETTLGVLRAGYMPRWAD